MLALPETNNKRLPHTIEDVENLSIATKKKDKNLELTSVVDEKML